MADLVVTLAEAAAPTGATAACRAGDHDRVLLAWRAQAYRPATTRLLPLWATSWSWSCSRCGAAGWQHHENLRAQRARDALLGVGVAESMLPTPQPPPIRPLEQWPFPVSGHAWAQGHPPGRPPAAAGG